MWDYQQELPWAKDGEKWMPLERVFKLGLIKNKKKKHENIFMALLCLQ